MTSVFVPVLYVVVVFGSLLLFSHFYRKRAAGKRYEPYFPSHPERNLYVTLLQRSDPPASDALFKSALLRRAMADVNRVIRIREDKPALQNLLQKGSVGDDLWNSLLAAEKELEAEIMEVVAEANTFVEGWGGVIFQTANEMIANEKMRAIFEQSATARAEKELKYGKKTSKALPSTITSPAVLPSSTPTTPAQASTLVKSSNGLAPPDTADVESIASSDGEAQTALSTPSKSPRKKGKKRK